MRPRRPFFAIALAAVLAVAACGDSATETTVEPVDECAAVAGVMTALSGLVAGADEGVDAVEASVTDLPEGVSADGEFIADSLRSYVTTLEEAGIDVGEPIDRDSLSDEQAEALARATSFVDNDDFAAATGSLSTFMTEQCSGQ